MTMRLGLPVKVLGRAGLNSNDTRRWQKNPHLKTSLEYLDRILDHLARHRIGMYRISSDLAPYATHPDMPQFHGMVAESDAELRAIGAKAKRLDIRVSFHPSQFVLLNSPDPELTRKSVWNLSSQAEMLDRMELGPEAVLVTHVGGTYVMCRLAERVGHRLGRLCPNTCAIASFWSMMISVSVLPMSSGLTSAPVCRWCSTISTSGV